MSNYTTPSGEVIYSKDISTVEAWKAFDKNSSTSWQTDISTNSYIGYKFTNPSLIVKFVITPVYNTSGQHVGAFAKDYIFQGSNDGTTWTDIKTGTLPNTNSDTTVIINNSKRYSSYRLMIANSYIPGIGCKELQLYGRS